MNDRIKRLANSRDARILAANARRLGDMALAEEAEKRALELQAIEEGFTSPAERAIGQALIVYEDEMSQLRGRKFRAQRTRDMIQRHTPLRAAERMVLTRKPSKGYTVLEEAGRRELSFEAIIDRFPDEFSEQAVVAARARLAGEAAPRTTGKKRPAQTQDISLSEADYAAALTDAALSDSANRWLLAHYYAPDAIASMEHLSDRLGYSGHRAANSGYGAAAHKIADALPRPPADVAEGLYNDWMQSIAVLQGRNSLGHSQWRLRSEVCRALEGLGWVEPANTEGSSEPADADEDEQRRGQQYGLSDTEVQQMMLSRRGQGRFRRDVLQFWGGACAVSGLCLPMLLVASHIKPWAQSNPGERLDGFNGLALSPSLDKCFDAGLVTFSADGRIRISDQLDEAARLALGINDRMRLRVVDHRVERYMTFHRGQIFLA